MATTAVSPEILERLFGGTDERYELVDGELRSKPAFSILHSVLMAQLGHILLNKLDQLGKSEEFWVLADPLAKIREDHWRRPDVAVIRAQDAEHWKYVMPGHWPVLCVELVSKPKQTVDELLEKCKIYHAQGVPHCWVFEPESCIAWQYDSDAEPRWVRSTDALTIPPIGISFSLDEIWKGLHHKRGVLG